MDEGGRNVGLGVCDLGEDPLRGVACTGCGLPAGKSLPARCGPDTRHDPLSTQDFDQLDRLEAAALVLQQRREEIAELLEDAAAFPDDFAVTEVWVRVF